MRVFAPDLLARLRGLPGVAQLSAEPEVHAVGGAVRDLLLGREPREVDLVVEGDAVALARRVGGAVTAHERFGTATVRIGGSSVDLASARRETYSRPGALPDVDPDATLEEDLRRRDFTVNAIAVRLLDGTMVAVPGAFDDLGAATLRVLHEGSFMDDPTRLLRLSRYGARLGFTPDSHTARLAQEAVAGGVLETVTAQRLGNEMRLAALEPQPAGLEALERNGLGRAVLHPGFRVDSKFITRALALCPDDARSDLVALAVSCAHVPGAELARRLGQLAFPAREVAVVAAAAAAAQTVDALDDMPDSAVADLFGPRPVEAAVVAAAAGAGSAARWLSDLRHRRLEISGADLLAEGLTGPAIGRGLAAARAAALDGRAPDRESQLAAALAGAA